MWWYLRARSLTKNTWKSYKNQRFQIGLRQVNLNSLCKTQKLSSLTFQKKIIWSLRKKKRSGNSKRRLCHLMWVLFFVSEIRFYLTFTSYLVEKWLYAVEKINYWLTWSRSNGLESKLSPQIISLQTSQLRSFTEQLSSESAKRTTLLLFLIKQT